MKALLVANSIAPPKTHNLAKLLELLLPVDFGVSVLMADCVLLTPFAVAEMYAPTPLDEATAMKVIAAGERVRDQVRRLVT